MEAHIDRQGEEDSVGAALDAQAKLPGTGSTAWKRRTVGYVAATLCRDLPAKHLVPMRGQVEIDLQLAIVLKEAHFLGHGGTNHRQPSERQTASGWQLRKAHVRGLPSGSCPFFLLAIPGRVIFRALCLS